MIKIKKTSKFIAVLAIIICAFSVIAFGTNATDQQKRNTIPAMNEFDVVADDTPESATAEPYAAQELPEITENTVHEPPQKTAAPISSDTILPENSYSAQDYTTQVSKEIQISDTAKSSKETSNKATDTKIDYSLSDPQYTPETTPIPSSETNTNISFEETVSKEEITNIEMGTHIEDVHKAIGVESQKNPNNADTEIYQLDDGNTAVLIYESDELKRGYILKDSD